ncbi:hypothetical protein LCGC14_0284070 [marine sediment metagenome]|uniref:peptide chain release factor N(5)-glutamine methyltransferase n=1 Tax=marine sediment metagenome TaxID=412755 RepID=A0A0F9UC02_9ZZZZ|nr:peptide chain release factor N(5)-glutamine methyltransferase [Phycisphaerae bacterium]HDZ43952.1 peptide chain release factor N(5)-glutamine methyltransferase [Phycisphaerae bacterium]
MGTEQPAGPWTVLKLLDWTRSYLERAGVDAPRLAGETLLAHVLACQRIDLYARFDSTPTPQQLAAYREFVRRVSEHEPVAYLVGEKEFYSLTFHVTPAVLIPRPETEILVSEAVNHLQGLGRPGVMWDVCTGSGCVGIATAMQVDDLTGLATDVSEGAVAVAQENAERHGVTDRLRFRVADLLNKPADCRDLSAFDVITTNPPYVTNGEPIAESVKREPTEALRAGPNGLDVIRPLIAAAPDHLNIGGVLILEFGILQGEAVCDLLDAVEQFDDPRVIRDHQDLDRAVVATRLS